MLVATRSKSNLRILVKLILVLLTCIPPSVFFFGAPKTSTVSTPIDKPQTYETCNTTDSGRVALKDMVVMVSVSPKSNVNAMWNAWGKHLGPTGSLEFYTLDLNQTKEPTIVDSSLKGVQLIKWTGNETGIQSSMSYKTKMNFQTCLQRHPTRKWFVKADVDTFIVVEALCRLLSKFDSSEPLYMGYTWTKYGHGYTVDFNSGAFYIFSRRAIELLQPVLESDKVNYTSADLFEDMMMGNYSARAGIKPVNLAPFVFWSNPMERIKEYPSSRYTPFVAVHNIKNTYVLMEMAKVADALVPHSYPCQNNSAN